MAYNDQENSIQDGAPYFLYEFNTSEQTFRYTDYPVDITWNTLLWSSFPIKHSEVKQSNELSKNSITITIPIDGELANKYVGWTPDEVVTVTIRRGHFGASDTLVYWKGRISGHNLKNDTVEFTCESVFTSLRRAGLRARFQRSCRHAVFGRGCNLNKDDFALIGTLSSVTSLTLNISEATGETDGWFNGGAIQFPDGSFRQILSHVGSSITIERASRYITDNFPSGYGYNYGLFYGGMSVILYPGCDRTLSTCKDKFDNLVNNGSFKWIPSKNPMGGSSIV